MSRKLHCMALFTAVCLFGANASANMSYSPWIHELVQKGQDVEVTVNVFEEASIETYYGVPFPSFDVSYTLTRWGWEEGQNGTVFQDRVFDKAEAVSVSELECQYGGDIGLETEICKEYPEGCIDCDGDEVPECSSFCAVAYRFTVVDECVPSSGPEDGATIYYSMTSRELEEMSQEFVDYEGFGHQNLWVEDTGDPCLDSEGTAEEAPKAAGSDDSGCSNSAAGHLGASPLVEWIALIL